MSAGLRWQIRQGVTPSKTAALLAKLREAEPRTAWVLLEEAQNGDLRFEWKTQAPPAAVVDALHVTDAAALQTQIKFLLKTYPQTRFTFLVPAQLEVLEIPDQYGAGEVLYGDDALSADAVGRTDAALLRHAHKLIPTYALADLILGPVTQRKFQEALSYAQTKNQCEEEWGFRKRHSRGHGMTVLFHGESGTGKTMAAEVLAAELGLPLYQVDLSSLVSKWVGETEKNLRAVFRAAEGVRGILLFDEGDAIFGSRTDTKNAQDRYANMEVNYLLQELERFQGILLLSTNHFQNMDPAFLRRFTFTITFGAPGETQREVIWKRNLPAEMPLAADVDLKHLASFGLTGGSIKNCIRLAAARALSRKASAVAHEDFLWGMKRELQKHDRELSREAVGETYWRKVAPDWEGARPR